MLVINTVGNAVEINNGEGAPVLLNNAQYRWYFYNGILNLTAGPCEVRAAIGQVQVNGDTPANEADLNTALGAVFPAASVPVDPGFTSYAALLNQVGTADPVATVAANGLANITWGYISPGVYFGNSLGPVFPEGRTVILTGPPNAPGFIRAWRQSDNQVRVATYNLAGQPADGLLVNLSLKIEVYPE